MTTVTRAKSPRDLSGRSPLVLVAATVGLGVVAHVLGGGPAPIDCLPLWAGTLLAVAGTLLAQRAMGGTTRAVVTASALLGLGQFGMHMALSAALLRHTHPGAGQTAGQTGISAELLSTVSCGLVAAHTAAAMVLVVLMLGAHQSVELTLHVLTRVCRRVGLLVVSTAPDDHIVTSGLILAPDPVAVGQRWRYGSIRSLRGPPALGAR